MPRVPAGRRVRPARDRAAAPTRSRCPTATSSRVLRARRPPSPRRHELDPGVARRESERTAVVGREHDGSTSSAFDHVPCAVRPAAETHTSPEPTMTVQRHLPVGPVDADAHRHDVRRADPLPRRVEVGHAVLRPEPRERGRVPVPRRAACPRRRRVRGATSGSRRGTGRPAGRPCRRRTARRAAEARRSGSPPRPRRGSRRAGPAARRPARRASRPRRRRCSRAPSTSSGRRSTAARPNRR